MAFMMKKMVIRFADSGPTSGSSGPKIPRSIKPATMTSTAKAANQKAALRRLSNSSAPTGDVSDHRMTPLELIKPPNTSMSSAGKMSVMSNWLKRNR